MDALADPTSRRAAFAEDRDYGDYIARALATPGGHLSIGRGGVTLYFGRSRLSGCHTEAIKTQAIAAGLPVIDSRSVPFAMVWELAVRGPMVAVDEPPSAPPYHALSSAPLAVVAQAYRAAGAEVFNLPPIAAGVGVEGEG